MRSSSLALLLVVLACSEPVSRALSPNVGDPAMTVIGDQGGRPLTADLTGPNEVPFPGGDADGTGSALITLNYGQGEVCWELSVANILPAIAAHIHRAPAGVNGPVVVPLTPPTGGSSSGCGDVDRALIKEILHDPEAFYVNVHNTVFPAGAVRGQLTK